MLSREWTDAQIKTSETCNVAVMYASAYGNTASLAQAISRGVTKAGQLLQLEQHRRKSLLWVCCHQMDVVPPSKRSMFADSECL